MLEAAAQWATIITSVSILIAMIQLLREARSQNLQSFFYLHEYLSQSEFGNCRRAVRTLLFKKPYNEWSNEDKSHANSVCASYDKAGILISAGVVNKRTKLAFLQSSWGQSIVDQYESLKDYLDDMQTPNQSGYEFFKHFGELYIEAKKYHPDEKSVIASIRSGGQTGSDRGALDAAIKNRTPIHGWCPKNGWAEDFPESPGLLSVYPDLNETPSDDVIQRTEWNVRDSDVTILFGARNNSVSKGTTSTLDFAQKLNKPFIIIDSQNPSEVLEELRGIGTNLDVNIAGPRESERPGSYDESFRFTYHLLEESRRNK